MARDEAIHARLVAWAEWVRGADGYAGYSSPLAAMRDKEATGGGVPRSKPPTNIRPLDNRTVQETAHAIDRLPRSLYVVVWCIYVGHQTHEVTAAACQVSEATVYNRLRAVDRTLRKEFDQLAELRELLRRAGELPSNFDS